MSKTQRIESALINTAKLDPADFTLNDYSGGVEVIHKATGHKAEIPTNQYIPIMGYTLAFFFTHQKGIPALNSEERHDAWCRWKGYKNTLAA